MGSSSHTPGGTRAALLTAARSRFATVGFDACRLTELCADAALTTGALYRNFSSKEALLDTLVVQLEADLADLDIAGPEAAPNGDNLGDSDIDAVAAVAEGWLQVVRRHRGAFRASMEQSLTRGDGTARRHRLRAHLADRLASALRHHRNGEVAASMAADTLEYTALAEALGWIQTRNAGEVADTLARVLSNGVYLARGEIESRPSPQRPDRKRERRMSPVLRWEPHPRRASPSTARGTDQVASILSAATEVFAAVGMGQATIEQIAERANVSSGTVYRYFTDKADVLACLAVRVEQALYESAVLPTDDTGRFAPDRAAHAYLSTRRDHLGVFRAWREVAITGGALADAWVAMHKEFSRGISGTVLDGQERGIAFQELDAPLVGDLVVAMFEQPAHSRIELGLDAHLTDTDVVEVIGGVLGQGLLS